jgi:hypothetical protein
MGIRETDSKPARVTRAVKMKSIFVLVVLYFGLCCQERGSFCLVQEGNRYAT